MNKQILTFVVCGIVLVVVAGYVVHNFTMAGCQIPSGNTKACYELPDDAVSSCEGMTQGDKCDGKSVYSIANFPDGTEDADEGRTKEEQADCYTSMECVWNTDDKKCELCDDASLPFPKMKTVAKEDSEIDDDDKCKPGGE